MARIIVTTSSGDQTPLELAPGQVFTIGRDATNRLPLPDATGVSRRHARIAPREGGEPGWEVADLGSTNGTRVGGQTVKSKVLSDGDELEIGSAKLRFEDPEEAERIAALGREGVCLLERVGGGTKGERIQLDAKRIPIGRRDANAIVLDDRMVSGHHAEIDRDLNGYTIRDLGSTNGTLVNGEPISEMLLTHGARVRIGNSRFVFKDPSMKDVEVELAAFEEDEGWGMMGEIDLSRSRGSKLGLLVVFLLFAAAGVGGWFLAQQGDAAETGGISARAGLVENGDFSNEDLLWNADTDEGVAVKVNPRGGRPGGWLSARNQGEADSGVVRVAYEGSAETAGSRPVHVTAQVKGQGDEGARFGVVWASDPTTEELKAGVTELERTDILAEASGGWRSVDETLVPPVWARTAQVVLLLPEGAGAGLDDVSMVLENALTDRPSLAVRTFKTAYVDGRGALDLLANRAVLLTGARPVARLADGTVLRSFRVDGEPVVSDSGVEIQGAFDGPEGGVPAQVRWTTTEEGLRLAVTCSAAEAVGLDAQVPLAHLGGTVSVLGDFLPQRIPVKDGQRLEKVARTLLGDPSITVGGQSTLLSFVQDDSQPVATLQILATPDDGLASFCHWIEGTEATLDVVTDFSKQQREAETVLATAKGLRNSSPGEAIRALRNVAQAYPFEEDVRNEATRLAGELEQKALSDVHALSNALRDFKIYRSAESLATMEKLSTRLSALFLGQEGAGGTLETEVGELVAEALTSRTEYETELAAPGVERLERLLNGLLGPTDQYKAIAALYARTLLARYGHLADKAPDLARRLDAARQKLDALEQLEGVTAALPPVPEAK